MTAANREAAKKTKTSVVIAAAKRAKAAINTKKDRRPWEFALVAVRAPGVVLCFWALLFSSPRSARAALSLRMQRSTKAGSGLFIQRKLPLHALIFFSISPSRQRRAACVVCSSADVTSLKYRTRNKTRGMWLVGVWG